MKTIGILPSTRCVDTFDLIDLNDRSMRRALFGPDKIINHSKIRENEVLVHALPVNADIPYFTIAGIQYRVHGIALISGLVDGKYVDTMLTPEFVYPTIRFGGESLARERINF